MESPQRGPGPGICRALISQMPPRAWAQAKPEAEKRPCRNTKPSGCAQGVNKATPLSKAFVLVVLENAFIYLFVCLFIFVFLSFLGLLLRHMEVPRLGSNRSCSRQPTPELQQHGIQALSVTHTTAHGNARSPTPEQGQGSNPQPRSS